jgi:hypothetical protein
VTRSATLAFLFVLVAARVASADEATDAKAAAEGFYAAYATFQPSDGIPDAKGRAKFEPYISEGLDKLLGDALAANARFMSAHKDSPPLIEGDLFTSNFEGASSHTVRPCAISGTTARCKVELQFQESGSIEKPVRWTDAVLLVATAKGWKVDNIDYGSSAAFGNKGSLADMLKRSIGNAGG